MNCAAAKKDLIAFVDDRLPASRRPGLESHLGECDGCRGEEERLRRNSEFLVDRYARLPGLASAAPEFLTDLLAPKKKTRKKPSAGMSTEMAATPAERRRITVWIVVAALIVLLGTVAVVLLLPRDREPERTDTGSAGNVAEKPNRDRRPTPAVKRPAPTPSHAEEPSIPKPDEEPEEVPDRPRFPTARKDYAESVAIFLRRPSTDALDQVRRAWKERPGRTQDLLLRLPRVEARDRSLTLLALLPARSEQAVLDEVLSRVESDGAADVRSAAAGVLAAADGDLAPADLVTVTPGVKVRVGPIRDRTRLDALLAAARSERDPSVLGVIIRLLGPSAAEVRDVERWLTELSESESPEVSAAALDALEGNTVLTPPEAVARARDTGISLKRRARAIRSLAAAENAVDLLPEFLRSDEPALQIAALDALKGHWDDGADRLILEVLRSREPLAVRLAALGIASPRGGKEVRDALREIATSEADPTLSRAAKEALRLKEERERRER